MKHSNKKKRPFKASQRSSHRTSVPTLMEKNVQNCSSCFNNILNEKTNHSIK